MRPNHGMLVSVLLIALAGFGRSSFAQSGDFENGIAIATSISGEVRLTGADGSPFSLSLHQQIELISLKIETGNDGFLMLALSNGMSLGIGAGTRFHIESYRQRPYSGEEENLDFEISESHLISTLDSGRVVFAADRLSPVSEVHIAFPNGRMQTYSSVGIVDYNSNGAHLFSKKGSITYFYPNGQGSEFVTANQSIRVSDQSAALGQIAERNSYLDATDEWARQLVEAAEYASRRVIFKVQGPGVSIPQPILVVKPGYLKQHSPRPYRYIE